MITYNKLVRDKIPQIIEADGKQYDIKQVDKEETIKYLITKFDEEISEFKEDHSIEELADILEIIHGIAHHMEFDLVELEKVRAEKAEKRGGFIDGVVLGSVW